MAFQMYGDVILTSDIPESGLRAGDIGTVVERHVVTSVPEEATRSSFST